MDQERLRSLREVLTERGVEGEGASLAFLGSGTKTLVTSDPKEEKDLLSMTLAKLAEVGKAVWEGSVPGQAYKWSEANPSPRAMLDSLIGGVEKNVNLEGPIPELSGTEKDRLYAIAEGAGLAGGMLRKVAVKDLAVGAKGIVKTAEGLSDPVVTEQIKRDVLYTLREVIPAARKVGQEWWDSISGASWKFFKDAETHGDFAADTTKAVRFSPYSATERTVYHEVPAHGGQYAPPEAIKKALVPYKGELVPATEVLDYMTQVSKAWRKYPDYMETLYAKDPTEMHARLVAKDMASGISAEEAFLTRLPKVVQAFEREYPQVAERYLTPMLSKVTERVEQRLMEAKARGELPKFPTGERLVESRGGALEAPVGKAEGSFAETYPTFEGYAARMKEMGIPLEVLAKEKAKSASRFVNVPANEEEYLARVIRERLGGK